MLPQNAAEDWKKLFFLLITVYDGILRSIANSFCATAGRLDNIIISMQYNVRQFLFFLLECEN